MLTVTPIHLEEANAFVAAHHRHNAPVPGAKFSVAVSDDAGMVRGVAIVGLPKARMLCDGWTLEVNRTCTDGTANANSMLYGAAWRAAKAMGYLRLVTYTQHDESGVSLRAAGWTKVRDLKPRKGWAESSTGARREACDPVGTGGVARCFWEIRATGDTKRQRPTFATPQQAAQPELWA
jgi:hypothetical protein